MKAVIGRMLTAWGLWSLHLPEMSYFHFLMAHYQDNPGSFE